MDPPPVSTTDQVTAVLEVLLTVAVNVRAAPVFSSVEAPETVTVTLGFGGGPLPPFPLPPQPTMHAVSTTIRMFFLVMVVPLRMKSNQLLSRTNCAATPA